MWRRRHQQLWVNQWGLKESEWVSPRPQRGKEGIRFKHRRVRRKRHCEKLQGAALFHQTLNMKKKKNPPKSVSFKFYWCSYKNALVVQCTDGAVARDGVQLTVAECLSRIPCLLILPHWLQLMGTANPWWFNQRNDGRLARYFTAIYCKRDGVLLMTPLLLSLPLPCLPLFSWSHFFFSINKRSLSHLYTNYIALFSLCSLSLCCLLPRCSSQIRRTRGLRVKPPQYRLHLCIIFL